MSYRELEAEKKSTPNYLTVFVKAVGILVLLFGVWIGAKVMSEAWALYQAPHHIERFASAVETGSNLDKVLSFKAAGMGAAHNSLDITNVKGYERTEQPVFKLSYFAAWGIVIMLLLLIGRLAMIAIKTGGELALYDRPVERFARSPSLDRARRRKEELKEHLRRS